MNPSENAPVKKDNREHNIVYRPPGGGHRAMFMQGKAALEHQRKVLWSWIFGHLRGYKGRYVAFGLFLVLGSIIMSFSPMIAKSMIDNAIIPKDLDILFNLSLFYLLLMSGIGILNYIGNYNMQKVGQNIIFNIRNELIDKLQGMSMSYFDKHLSGDIISITTNDVDQLNNLVGNQLIQIVISFISLAFNIIFMFILHPVLAMFAAIALPVFFILLKLFKRAVTGAFKDVRKKMSGVTSSIQENIAGAKVVQAFGQEDKAAREFDQANKENYQAGFKVRKIMSTFFPLASLVSASLTALVLYMGGLLSLDSITFTLGSIAWSASPGTLIAFNGLLAQFFQPFMTLMQFQQIIESAMAASDRIYGLLEEESELPDPAEPQVPPRTGEIRFENISFGYRFVENNGEGAGGNKKEPAPEMNGRPPMGAAKPMGTAGGMMGMGPMNMMPRVREFLSKLPEPHKSFMMDNIPVMPVNLRMPLMMQLMNVPLDDAPAKIDEILKEHGYAIPGTKTAMAHPTLKTEFPASSVMESPGGMKPQSTKNSGGGAEKPVKATAMPASSPAMDKSRMVQMAKMLAKTIKPKASIGGGSGGGMGGGGGMPGMDSSVMLKRLAMMPIPDDVLDEFPDVVKEAIAEEKILIERENTVGFVLKDLSATISAGETVAIVGETGAGKTTLIKLISRFYDVNDGRIVLDGIDIRNMKKSTLRRLIGMVPQDSFLFVGTIKENLLYGVDEITPEIEEKMVEISKFLGLHNFIEALPDGYSTKLKENSSNISIGQRQLMAFARALMTDPVILILDEATSSVDPYTESLIQDALDRARSGRTTIIIAHRLSTIKNADKIFVIGKEMKGIIEQGTHDELIKANGKYKRLLDMQRKEIEQEY
ncbi:MAG: ABC transporter ATP-binding protein [Promethearchaeota archaeon]